MLDNIVAVACNLDEKDDIEYIETIRIAAEKVLSTDSLDTLRAIYQRGPLYDGDVPSKSDRNTLLEIGVINKCIVRGDDGYQSCNYLGRDVIKVFDLRG